MGQEEGGLLPHPRDQFVQIVGGGRAGPRGDALGRRHVVQQAVFTVVDELAFLPLLDRLDGQAQLLGDLVVRRAVQVGHAGMDVDHGIDRAQHVFARLFFVIDEGLRQHALVAGRTVHRHGRGVLHLVQAEDAGLDGHPFQAVHQPARSDAPHLGSGLGRIGKLPRGNVAKGRRCGKVFSHFVTRLQVRRRRRGRKEMTSAPPGRPWTGE
jgi:hypothetical protein